jgi:hypothetical protein
MMGGSEPFAIYYIYTPDGNFIVKGMADEVEEHVKLHFPISFFRSTYWAYGKSRGLWRSFCGIYIQEQRISADEVVKRICGVRTNDDDLYSRGRIRYVISWQTENGYMPNALILRRMPHKWLPIFDKTIFEKKPNVPNLMLGWQNVEVTRVLSDFRF